MRPSQVSFAKDDEPKTVLVNSRAVKGVGDGVGLGFMLEQPVLFTGMQSG